MAGDPAQNNNRKGIVSFNPRPRMAGDRGLDVRNRLSYRCFNPRPRTAGDMRIAESSSSRRFNPRPRTAGDVPWICIALKELDVSTHARARRATAPGLCIPAIACFNPRPRTAGDGDDADLE